MSRSIGRPKTFTEATTRGLGNIARVQQQANTGVLGDIANAQRNANTLIINSLTDNELVNRIQGIFNNDTSRNVTG